jgi:hypothetical protein
MGNRRRSRLSVASETVRVLSASDLAGAAGGFTNVSDSCACNSFVCSIASNCPTLRCKEQ